MKQKKLNNYKDLNDTFNKNTIGTTYPHKIATEITFDDYLANNDDIKNMVMKFMTSNDISFVCAPTGTGKTVLIGNLFSELNKIEKNEPFDEEKMEKLLKQFGVRDNDMHTREELRRNHTLYMNIMATSARSQTLQIGADNNVMKPLVGKSKENQKNVNIDLMNNNNFVMTYDMAFVIDELLDTYPGLKVRLVIDEAHNCSEADYRKEKLDVIEKVAERILANGGSVIYLTATYEAMAYLYRLDNILFCEKKNQKRNFNKLVINTVNSSITLDDALGTYLQNQNALVRYNSLKSTDKLVQGLRCMGKNVQFINANEKDYHYDDEGNIIYNNEMMHNVIMNSTLPDGTEIAFSTSLLDCGTNIKLPENYMNSVFVIGKPNHLSMSNIEQFANRVRTPYNLFELFMREAKEEKKKPFLELNKIIEKTTYERKITIHYLHTTQESIKEKYENKRKNEIKYYGSCNEEKLHKEYVDEINKILKLQTYDRLTTNDMNGAIYYNEETDDFDVDEKFFLNYCMFSYNIQFNNNIDKFVKKLEDKFEIEVEVKEINKDCIKFDNNSIDEAKTKLLKMAANTDFIKEVEEGTAKIDREIMPILLDAKKLNKLGMNLKDAINFTCNADEKTLRTKNNELLKNTLSVKLLDSDYKLIQDFYNKDIDYMNIGKSREKEIIDLINSNEFLSKRLKKGVKMGADAKDLIEVYMNNDSEKALKSYMDEYQAVFNNKNYLINRQLLSSKVCQEQLYVIEQLHLLKENTYSKDDIHDFTEKFNNHFKKSYKDLTMRHYIETIAITDIDRKGNVTVRGLKLAL